LRVGIIGAGVVGAAIAYELSNLPGLEIHVFDQHSPQTGHTTGHTSGQVAGQIRLQSTGAALGVLIAVASPKVSSHHLQLRFDSLRRFETLIPELEAALSTTPLHQHQIPYNRQGILELCHAPAAWSHWHKIASVRQEQGWGLELLTIAEVNQRYPLLHTDSLQGAVYSPQDRQIDPVALTQALIAVAQARGVEFHFESPVVSLCSTSDEGQVSHQMTHLRTATAEFPLDQLVIAAGIGSLGLTQALGATVDIRPVLGQALQLSLPQPWLQNWPVVQGSIEGTDVHLVPINPQALWVGATVEFPIPDPTQPQGFAAAQPSTEQLEKIHQQAIKIFPSLGLAQVKHTWSGLRPRPEGRTAPIIEPLASYQNVLLATGHYRNGILLAPITALNVKQYFQADRANRLANNR
jgi:glycine/D-amino acid oxidase-like deaminating enzyme